MFFVFVKKRFNKVTTLMCPKFGLSSKSGRLNIKIEQYLYGLMIYWFVFSTFKYGDVCSI